MLQLKSFENAEKALLFFLKDELDHRLIRHNLSAKEIMPEEVHLYNEWIILPRGFGKCIIAVGDSSEVIELSRENVIVVLVPARTKHSLEALSNLSYLVVKDGFD